MFKTFLVVIGVALAAAILAGSLLTLLDEVDW